MPQKSLRGVLTASAWTLIAFILEVCYLFTWAKRE